MATLLLLIGSWVRVLGGGWGWLRWAGLGWARLVCGFVGLWVALGFVWVSFPRATSEGFSFSTLIAGVEMSDPPGNRTSIRTIDPQEQTWIWGGDLVRKYGRNTDEIREVSRDPLC